MLTNGQYAYQNHNNNLHLVAVFSLSRFLFVFLPPSVPEQNLVRLMALVFLQARCSSVTQLSESQSTDGNIKHRLQPVAWPHTFFIDHQNADGRAFSFIVSNASNNAVTKKFQLFPQQSELCQLVHNVPSSTVHSETEITSFFI